MMDDFVDFMFLGYPKSGTSSMFWLLEQHPELNASREKETRFFSWGNHMNLLRNTPKSLREEYMKWWDVNDRRLKYELSPNYYTGFSQTMIKKVKPKDKSFKIIFLLRNPVERFISEYIHMRSLYLIAHDERTEKALIKDIDWVEQWKIDKAYYKNLNAATLLYKTMHIGELIKHENYHGFESGEYICHITKAFNVFSELPRENFKFIIYDDFRRNWKKTMKDLCNFLGVYSDHKFYDVRSNESSFWRKYVDAYADIKPKHIKHLKDYYRPYNSMLEDLLEKKLDWENYW